MPNDSEVVQRAAWFAPQGPREGLDHYVQVVRERKWLIICCVVLATVAAGVYAKLAPRTWQAESQLLVTPVNGETSLIGLSLLTNTSNPTGAVSTAASFVTTPQVGALVATNVGNTTSSAALEKVSATPVASSNVVAITAKASSAALAQALANGFALATVQNRTQMLHKELEKIIPTLQARVEALPPAQRTGAGSLGERLASLQTLLAGSDPTISVESLAQLPTSPSSPKPKLDIAAGLLVGLVIGLGAAFAREGLDPRVLREEQLRGIIRLPVLARIPHERSRFSRTAPLRPGDLSPAAQEAYRMLRVALGVRSASPSSRSVMVTGSMRSEGKSTTALNLAATIAAGGRRVILVEADLQRPSLATALGIHAPQGVAEVLMGDISFEDALVVVEGTSDNLSVLLAGRYGSLVDGLLTAANRLVEPAKELADYVIFDTPPATDVSDILPLSQHVDDVLIVSRLGHSRIDQLVNLGEVLSRQGVSPTGLVIVDDDLSQGRGYYYAETPQPRRLGPLSLGGRARAARS
jgi:succinoglycan biosynthesis transport protein ExoP